MPTQMSGHIGLKQPFSDTACVPEVMEEEEEEEGGLGSDSSAIGGWSKQLTQPIPLLPAQPPSPPAILLGREIQEGGRESRDKVAVLLKEVQETLPCYIITSPGIMCNLIKIHAFSPPPTRADHRGKGNDLLAD